MEIPRAGGAAPVPTWRCNAVRYVKGRGYEYGYYTVDERDREKRVFVLIGIARSWERAEYWLSRDDL